MGSNSPDQPSIENLIAMQQAQIYQLQQLLETRFPLPLPQPQPGASQSSTNGDDITMDVSDEINTLRSFSIRPSYTWTLHRIIERYPTIANIRYQPPDMIPDAARKMNKSQRKQDTSFKHLQCLVSGLFRPLDILSHELSLDVNNTHLQRYLSMLADCRLLLLNLSFQINQMRTNLAF
ncbi:MAG: hypothetical protein EXX96DRAFT_642847 [Benjaminiella poitrasii]|nr:MAG: hypothetical protein EXX96DRAFT_642847 [Benjaminiella poitrasii]